VPTADPTENIDDLFAQIADLDTPLPVLDDSGKLEGIIVKTTVLANLAGKNLK